MADPPPPVASLVVLTLEFAALEVGVTEQDKPERIAEYLASVGLEGRRPWCAAFVYFIVDVACRAKHLPNPLPRTGGVLKMWQRAKGYKRSSPIMGTIFFRNRGHGRGHAGFVVATNYETRKMTTIEGNVKDAVVRRIRDFSFANVGFVEI